MFRRIFTFGMLAFSLSSCAYERATLDSKLDAEVKASDQGLIPTAAFFGETAFQNVKISPDGRFIGTIFTENGKKVLGIASRDLSKLHTVIRFAGHSDVVSYDWANDERLVVRAGETYGNLDGRYAKLRYYFVNYDGTAFKDFFAKEWAYYDILNLTPEDPNSITMVKYHGRTAPVAVRFNINTGSTQVVSSPPRASSAMLANDKGEANVALIGDKEEPLEKQEIAFRIDGKWESLIYPTKGDTQIEPVYLDSTSGDLFLLSSRETDRKGLYTFNVKTKKLNPLFVHEKVDVENLIEEDGRIVGLVFEDGRPQVVILDGDSTKMKVFKELQKIFPDELVTGITLTKDKKSASFRVSSDRNPGTYYLLDDVTKFDKIKLLGHTNKVIKEANLGPREPFQFKARDGLEIPGYITLPPGAELKQKRPMIVSVHGGPFGIRDGWGYAPDEHFFASRGYVVMQVNYRGSGGYGEKFLKAGWKQYGKAMQDDVTDATKWAIAQGIADPSRICIFGGSYGGYATLQGLVKEPDLYKCGISYVGVSDLTLRGKEGDTSEVAGVEKWMTKTMGNDYEELKKYSPAYHADQIKVPVFIVHGADDRRVPIIHANRMREGLEQNKKPFEWMVKKSEGHGFTQPANRIEAYHAMLKFIEKAIGKGDPVAPAKAQAQVQAP